MLPKTDYHHEVVERAKREIKEEIQTIKEKGFQEAVVNRFKAKYLPEAGVNICLTLENNKPAACRFIIFINRKMFKIM